MNGKISWQYIAGFLDGEGTISQRKKGNWSVEIYQCTKQAKVLFEIQKFLAENNIESHIYKRRHKRQYENTAGMWLAISKTKEVLKFLLMIKGFLIVKKEQCENAIKDLQIKTKRGKVRLTREEKERIKELWNKGKTVKEIAEILRLNYNTLNSMIYVRNTKEEFDKKPIEKVCPVCGKSFLTSNRRKKFCSRECHDKKYLKVKNKSKT